MTRLEVEMSILSEHQGNAISAAVCIIDEAWEELKHTPFVNRRLGVAPRRLPDISLAETERHSGVGRSLCSRIDGLDMGALPHDMELTLRLVRFRARIWSREASWYWTVVDPLGIGFFGMFLPTAYCGGLLLDVLHGEFSSFRFSESGDADRYLSLVSDYARLIEQFSERTSGQAARGVRMPRVQIRQARALLGALRSGVPQALGVASHRRAGVLTGEFDKELRNRISKLVGPAFEKAIDDISEDYYAQAPEEVGLTQYEYGAEVYAELVKLHTTLDLTPNEVHLAGHARMAEIEDSMRAIRDEVGFQGSGADFLKHLNTDESWRRDTIEGVTAVFQRYIDRLKPSLGKFFAKIPEATYGVAPLPDALQGSMTFGYYDAPRLGKPEGRYLFNSANLTGRALFQLGSLTFHELMPGHHLQLATQQENVLLHPFRNHSLVNAYCEGWAEYAATFAGEIGLYEHPAERYGRLLMDAFLTCRLVVDTGMNALGWSLEDSAEYMRQHSGMTDAEILTELVRYSCDIPGQSLAYKLGDTYIIELREQMRCALGSRFDLKDFHAAALTCGAITMPDLRWHVRYETERLSGSDN